MKIYSLKHIFKEFADQWECQGNDNDFGDDILAEILAVSQQEYIDSLKRSKVNTCLQYTILEIFQ